MPGNDNGTCDRTGKIKGKYILWSTTGVGNVLSMPPLQAPLPLPLPLPLRLLLHHRRGSVRMRRGSARPTCSCVRRTGVSPTFSSTSRTGGPMPRVLVSSAGSAVAAGADSRRAGSAPPSMWHTVESSAACTCVEAVSARRRSSHASRQSQWSAFSAGGRVW